MRHVRRVLRATGLLQLDFVNVLIPAHYLVVYSRVGPYDLACFERALYRIPGFAEQWAHEASIVPCSMWPLLEYRRQRYKTYPGSPLNKLRNKSRYLSDILEIAKEKGEVTSQDLAPVAGPKRRPGDWHRSVPRWALEFHFGKGALAVSRRLPNFQRVYALPERVIPACDRDRRVATDDAHRQLLHIAANACGIATAEDLIDYFRMSPKEARPRIAELVDNGDLLEVAVEGWDRPGLLNATASVPRKVERATLLSPFDPLVWFRPRAERLFGFHYRIEIYVPEAKRRWGYYVLPFLLGDQLVARVDVKAERAAATLAVRAAYREPHAEEAQVAAALAAQLWRLAGWLGLAQVRVGPRGDLARALRRAVKGTDTR